MNNINLLSIIFFYAFVATFYGLWAMFHYDFHIGISVMVTHIVVMAFTANKIENIIKTK